MILTFVLLGFLCPALYHSFNNSQTFGSTRYTQDLGFRLPGYAIVIHRFSNSISPFNNLEISLAVSTHVSLSLGILHNLQTLLVVVGAMVGVMILSILGATDRIVTSTTLRAVNSKYSRLSGESSMFSAVSGIQPFMKSPWEQ